MGNTDSKHGKSLRRIEAEEVKLLSLLLGVRSESDTLSRDRVYQSLGWDESSNCITSRIWKTLVFSHSDPKFKQVLDFIDSMVFQDQSIVAKHIVRMLDNPSKESLEIFTQDLVRFHSSILTPSFKSWLKIGVVASDNTNTLLSDRLICTLQDICSENIVESIDIWLQKEPLLFAIQRHVFHQLFKLSTPLPELLPQLTSQLSQNPVPSVMDINDIIFLNHSLPHDLQSEWNLTFSTRIHGLSFSSMLAKVINKGPTLVIVEDSHGHVFGGFASESWRISPKFLGDSSCFLCQIRPKMAIYTSTGYNDHFMYLNHQQQTMPNGLGMGGQLGHFGIWIDADFGKGHCSEGCSTYYHVPTLSSEKDFVIEHIEVWAVGPPPKQDSDEEEVDGKRSILDKDSGAKALLELVDRGHHSDGLRDVPDD